MPFCRFDTIFSSNKWFLEAGRDRLNVTDVRHVTIEDNVISLCRYIVSVR